MSRPLRIQYPDAWYHIMNRGRRGEKIFLSPDAFEDIPEIKNLTPDTDKIMYRVN